jgi:hypothetical protein
LKLAGVWKWGKMEEKGCTAFEASTCFMEWDVSEVCKFQIHKQVYCKWWMLFVQVVVAESCTLACQYPPSPAPHSWNLYQVSFCQIWTVSVNALALGGSYTGAVTLDTAETPARRLGVKWKALVTDRFSFEARDEGYSVSTRAWIHSEVTV